MCLHLNMIIRSVCGLGWIEFCVFYNSIQLNLIGLNLIEFTLFIFANPIQSNPIKKLDYWVESLKNCHSKSYKNYKKKIIKLKK